MVVVNSEKDFCIVDQQGEWYLVSGTDWRVLGLGNVFREMGTVVYAEKQGKDSVVMNFVKNGVEIRCHKSLDKIKKIKILENEL